MEALKKWSLLLVVFILSQSVFAQEHMHRVMTFNIRFDNPKDGEHAWEHRKEFVADVIQYNRAGVIGMQEVLFNQVKDLDSILTKYTWVGVGREDGENGGEFNPIFYRNDRFTLVDNNTFWLSESPSEPGSMGWDAACPRIVTWVRLRVKNTNKEFFIFNTHLDHQGTIARLNSAKLLIDTIHAKVDNRPVVVTGDFNSLRRSGPYQHLTHWNNAAGLRDASEIATEGHYGPSTTYIGFEPDFSKNMVIDYIFINKKVSVHRHVIVDDRRDTYYPSDHLPVLSEIWFKK